MAATQTQRQAAYRERKRKEGLCLRNGCHEDAEEGYLYCASHRKADSAHKAKRYADANNLYLAGKWHPCLRCLKASPKVKPSARYDPICQMLTDSDNEKRRRERARAKKKSKKS